MMRRNALYILILGVVAVGLLGRALRPGRVLAVAGTEQWVPWAASATPEERALPQITADAVRENLPYRILLHRTIAHGHIPWWVPEIYCGMPFVALNHTEVFYPPSIVASFFNPYASYGWLIAFHLVVAGATMFWFLRTLRLDGLPSFFGALAFMLNGMFVTRHGHPQFVATGCWLPVLLVAVNYAVQRRRLAAAWLMAGGVAMCVLAGHPSIYVYGFYFVLAYFLCRAFLMRPAVDWRTRIRSGLALGAAAAVGLAMVSTQLLATWELSHFSVRAEQPFEVLKERTLPPVVLLHAIFPDLHGSPVNGTEWLQEVKGLYTAGALYGGILTLALGAYGAARGGRNGRVLLAMALTVLAVIFVKRVYYVLFHMLPGFEFSRVDRLSIAYFLSIAILAAIGLQAALSPEHGLAAGPASHRRRRASWLAGGIAVGGLLFAALVREGTLRMANRWGLSTGSPVDISYLNNVVALAGVWILAAAAWFGLCASRVFRGRAAAIVLIVLSGADLLVYANRFVVARSAQRIFRTTPAIDFVQSLPPLSRIAKFGEWNNLGKNVFTANVSLVFGVQDFHGMGPMHLMGFDELTGAMDRTSVLTPWAVRPFQDPLALESPALDAAAATHIVSDRPLRLPTLRPVHAGDAYIYENGGVLPRAFFVPEAIVEPDRTTAAILLASGRIDPRRTALVETPPPFDMRSAPPSSDDATVGVATYEDDHVVARKRGGPRGLLVLADACYPGWHAYVDGVDTPILRANVVFRAVPVGEGDHDVVFRYRPTFAGTAMALTIPALGAWGALSVALVVSACRRRRRRVEPSASTR